MPEKIIVKNAMTQITNIKKKTHKRFFFLGFLLSKRITRHIAPISGNKQSIKIDINNIGKLIFIKSVTKVGSANAIIPKINNPNIIDAQVMAIMTPIIPPKIIKPHLKFRQ